MAAPKIVTPNIVWNRYAKRLKVRVQWGLLGARMLIGPGQGRVLCNISHNLGNLTARGMNSCLHVWQFDEDTCQEVGEVIGLEGVEKWNNRERRGTCSHCARCSKRRLGGACEHWKQWRERLHAYAWCESL